MSPARYRPNPWTPLLPMMLLFLTICATSAEDVTSGQAPATAPATALPEAAVAILTSEHDQEAALRAKLDQDLAKLHQATITRLRKVEDRALSAKDLDGAEAVKAAIVKLGPAVDDTADIRPEDTLTVGDICIYSATYGTEDNAFDCMPLIRRIAGGEKSLTVDNNSMGRDPAPNTPKHVYIKWMSQDGGKHLTTLEEGHRIDLSKLN